MNPLLLFSDVVAVCAGVAVGVLMIGAAVASLFVAYGFLRRQGHDDQPRG